MQIKAKLNYARITPRKMRLMGDFCEGLKVDQAHFQLRFSPKRGSKILAKLLDSAIANAKEKGGMDMDNLFVKQVLVDEGPRLKRFLPRSMGRATKVLKRMSHITLILDEAR